MVDHRTTGTDPLQSGILSPHHPGYIQFEDGARGCDVCGRVFYDNASLARHRASHFRFDIEGDSRAQWDWGQNDLRNGVFMLWDSFMKDHDLPKIVFLYGSSFLSVAKGTNTRLSPAAWLPVYLRDKVRDDMTGELHDAIVLNHLWLRLDPEAKCSSLAHLAAHIENHRHGSYDVTFNRLKRHNRSFKMTAETYDLQVSCVPTYGFAMTHLTDRFREGNSSALRLISRFHPMTVVYGNRGDIKCDIDAYSTADWTGDELRDFENLSVVPCMRTTTRRVCSFKQNGI